MSKTVARVIGRDAELDVISAFLGCPDDGAGALVLEGPPGIGKTTLWRRGADDAEQRGYRVVACSGAVSEAQFSFTALRDLVDVAFDEVGDRLPPPERRALEVALLRAEPEGSAQGPAAVAAAFLTVLRELASRTRLLVAIDDAQWLDSASALVLQFAARRLEHEPVRLLLTVRSEGDAPSLELVRSLGDRVRRIEIGPLTLGALQRLLHERLGHGFARPALRRIHEASGGNPFFALELARVLDEDSLVGDVLPIPETLRELVHGRLEELPRSCRPALVNVAALGHAKTSLLASVVRNWDDVCELAVDAGVLEVRRDRVSFTHPLLASAVYAAAPEERRRAVHRALAEAVDDPEQRAWHLARATEQPDEDIAAALESAARRVAARGAPDTAAELAEHARRLTPGGHSDAEARRRLDAAMYTWAAGDGARSRQLLAELIASLPPCVTRARARQLLVKIVDDISETIDELEGALDDAAGDLAEQASVRNLLARQRIWGGDFAGAIADARIAAELASTASAPAELAVALAREAQARLFAGEPLEYELLASAVALEEQLGDAIPVGDSPTRLRGWCALCVDDLETALECTVLVDRRAASRAESWRAVVLNTFAEVELRRGATDEALRHVQEAEEIATYWVTHAEASVLAAAALVKAVAGQVEEARTAGTRALELMRSAGHDHIVRSAERALGFLELSLGNAAAAHAVLEPLIARSGVGHPTAAAAAPDDIEALLELGKIAEAEAVLAALTAHVARTGRPRATAAQRRCEALIAALRGELDVAAAYAQEAIAISGEQLEPLEHGRALLVLGQIRRRGRQKRAAREALEAARALFEECSAPLWVERTRAELSRIGGRAASRDELTPSERRVVELVAMGRTNREAAAELFVSVHTVEKALTRSYRKLGLRSRAELARRLAELRISGGKE